MLAITVPATGRYCSHALAMPNTDPAISSEKDAEDYHREIVYHQGENGFQPLMAIKLRQDYQPTGIRRPGVYAAKLYPVRNPKNEAGVPEMDTGYTDLHEELRKDRGSTTTNAEGGVYDLRALAPFLKVLEEQGIVLSIHAEDPSQQVMEREEAFLRMHLHWLVSNFPKLRIVLEHLSTRAGVDAVRAYKKNVFGSITAHHLLLIHDDVCGGKLQPHHHCMPTPKSRSDMRSLIAAAASGDSRFFFGSDSAPHTVENKECASGCAGVFTAPVAPAVLAQLFEAWSNLRALEGFTSLHARYAYDLSRDFSWDLTFVREPWMVPERYGDIVPFLAGKRLEWQVARS